MVIISAAAGLVLCLIGVLHLAWAFSPWPLESREELARTVVGRPDGDLPLAIFVPACFAVAAALGVGGYLVAAEGGVFASGLPDRLVTIGTAGVAVVLLARAVQGLVESGRGSGDSPASYRRLDLRVYSPLCLVLGAAAAIVAVS